MMFSDIEGDDGFDTMIAYAGLTLNRCRRQQSMKVLYKTTFAGGRAFQVHGPHQFHEDFEPVPPTTSTFSTVSLRKMRYFKLQGMK